MLQAGNKAKRKVGKDDGNTTTTTTNTGNTTTTTNSTTTTNGTTTNTTTTGNTLETKEEGAPVPKVDVPLVTIYINGVPCHPTTMVTLLQKQSEASTTDSANQSAKQSAKQSANNTSASTTSTTTSTTTDTTTTNNVVEVPSDAVADRLNFIINNSTDSNVLAKVREARDVLEPKYFKWLANQLVVKRICTQPNYHPTYLKFVTGLKMDGFEEAVSPMLCFLCFLPYV